MNSKSDSVQARRASASKSTRSGLDGSVFSSLFFTLTACFFISLSFAWSPPQFDEVFLIFFSAREYYENPSKLRVDSFAAGQVGWEQGRFVSPLLHILSSALAPLAVLLSETLHLNILIAYGFVSILATMLLGGATWLLFLLLLPRRLPANLANLSLTIGGLSLAFGLISNAAYSSVRMQPGAYTVALVISVLLLCLVAYSARIAASGRSIISLSLAALSGLGLGSTYEMTQLFGPIAVGVFFISLWSALSDGGNRSIPDAVSRGLKSGPLYAFLFAFSVPFFLIRLRGISVCEIQGCYAPSNVNPGGFDVELAIDRAISGTQAAQVLWAMAGDGTQFLLPTSALVLAFFLIFVSLTLGPQFSRARREEIGSTSDIAVIRRFALMVISLGVLSIAVFGSGIALSQAYQESALPLGRSSIDSIVHAFAWSFIGMGLGALTITWRQQGVRSRLLHSGLVLLLSTAGTLTFLTNSETTRAIQSYPGVFLQERFASELNSPNLEQVGDAERCNLVSLKLNSYPEWRGHDGLLVLGLNRNMESKYGIPFCSLSEEKLFENYPEG